MVTVYHGSPNLFKDFDFSRVGETGTAEGYGLYFTTNMGVARNYIPVSGGYLYKVKLHTKKSLSNKRRTIKKDDLRTFMTILHQKTNILENYDDIDFYGLPKVLNEAVNMEYNDNKDDVAIINSIARVIGHSREYYYLLREVLGYDSVRTKPVWGQTVNDKDNIVYVALITDIIEIVDVMRITKTN